MTSYIGDVSSLIKHSDGFFVNWAGLKVKNSVRGQNRKKRSEEKKLLNPLTVSVGWRKFSERDGEEEGIVSIFRMKNLWVKFPVDKVL